MELVFRQRVERPDKHGHCAIIADLHWAGGQRVRLPVKGVAVLPAHWQPTKAKRIHTSAENAAQLNLKITRFQTAIEEVFQHATAARRDESAVSRDELTEALAAVGLRKAAPHVTADSNELTPTSEWAAFNERWQRENQHQFAADTLRTYQQVLGALTAFDPALRLAGLTRERLAGYVSWLHQQGKRDSTVQRHYKFFRECFRLLDKAVPKWLTVPTARYGRPLALKRAEVQALLAADLPEPALAEERDAFLLQTLLLLRDVDLRALRRHHVSPQPLPGLGEVLCVELYQQKTGEPVRIPLPPAAQAIWARHQGPPPLPSQQERNRRLKLVGQAAGLTREAVQHSFSGKTHHEKLAPVWQALTTHTARHTGAALVLLGSDGDQSLKEIALGHVTASAYGHDTLERYGPLLLAAWAEVL